MTHWIVDGMLIVFILTVLWMVNEIRQAPLLDDLEPCPYCSGTGYVRFEVWSAAARGAWPRREMHERPCLCTAGVGKTRRRVA